MADMSTIGESDIKGGSIEVGFHKPLILMGYFRGPCVYQADSGGGDWRWEIGDWREEDE